MHWLRVSSSCLKGKSNSAVHLRPRIEEEASSGSVIRRRRFGRDKHLARIAPVADALGLTRRSSATAGESERGLQWICFHKVRHGIRAASGWLHRMVRRFEIDSSSHAVQNVNFVSCPWRRIRICGGPQGERDRNVDFAMRTRPRTPVTEVFDDFRVQFTMSSALANLYRFECSALVNVHSENPATGQMHAT